MDHMRLKFSFEDIKKLFNYIDKKGQGEIGYDEFTLLLEERWRGIDPVEHFKAQLKSIKSPMETTEKPYLEIYDDCKTDEEVLEYLDKLGKNKTKVPLRKSEKALTSKINHTNAETYLNLAYNMPTKGKVSRVDNHMTDIIKHDYLRKSME